ncbi:MAG TPA: anion transporter [Planctomycetes bacterium]|nr:anion transporter [Planctomycetota bacterium]
MNIPIVTLVIVFVLIAVRQIGNVRLAIWQIMLGGAAVVVATGQISPRAALRAIDIDVMLFLFGMFVIGQALEESGYLAHVAYKYFKRARSIDSLVLCVIFGAGAASAFLMNDTLAIAGTPVVLLLARKHGMCPKMLLLALAFAVTIGSVASPIGNPQNLLIALNGTIANPFVHFARWLLVPTIANLFIAYLLLKRYYPAEFHDVPLRHSHEPIRNRDLARLAKISLQLVLALVALKVLTVLLGLRVDFRLTYIALASALPILAASRRRWRILARIDWHTLVFFAAMFVLMESVWDSGVFQALLARAPVPLTSVEMIFLVSIGLSQCISNVPLVALYQKVLLDAGTTPEGFIALAAGSTIAGNLFILGAASNVIIIQNAEKRSPYTLTFREFARIGVPLTIINAFVYWLFFCIA